MNRTLAIIKPDVSAEQGGEIMVAINAARFRFGKTKMVWLTSSEVDVLYAAHVERDFYPAMREFMCSGEVVVTVLERKDAVAAWRLLMGETDPRKAAKGTIRARFGDKSEGAPAFRNAVHGSDSEEAAEREIALFFGASERVEEDPVRAAIRRARLRPPLPKAERQRLIALDAEAGNGPTTTTEGVPQAAGPTFVAFDRDRAERAIIEVDPVSLWLSIREAMGPLVAQAHREGVEPSPEVMVLANGEDTSGPDACVIRDGLCTDPSAAVGLVDVVCGARSWRGRACSEPPHDGDFHKDSAGGWKGDARESTNGVDLPDDVRRSFLAYVEELPGSAGRLDAAGRVFDALDVHCGVTWAEPCPKPPGEMQVESIRALDAEIVRARAKFPGRRFLLAALAEEVGELALAIGSGETAAIIAEAIQVAAVAVRIVEEGDATTYHPDRLISLVHSVGGVARGLLQRNTDAANFGLRSLLTRARAMVGDGDPTFDDITDEEAKL